MKLIHQMLIRGFFPVFVLALIFFSMILQLADIFTNLWRYLSFDVKLIDIARIQLLYFPKTISYALPVSLLFAVSFTLGNLYSNNELISVFGSGISIYKLVLPFLLLGLFFSVGNFFFEEFIVIKTFQQKNDLAQELLRMRTSFSNTDVTILSKNSKIIYHCDYYDDNSKILSGVLILVRDEEGNFYQSLIADSATWNTDKWEFRQTRLFYWREDRISLTEKFHVTYSSPDFNQEPETFRNTSRNVEEMRMGEARQWIESLKRAGFPVRAALTEYYKRFAFSLTPFIVILISSSIGGRFKKNILLMSLLLSLVISVVYYVTQMITVILAKLDYIPPVTGAWAAFVLFLFLGIGMFRVART